MQSFPVSNHKVKFNQFTIASLLTKGNLFNAFPIHAVHLLIPGSEKLIKGCEEILTSSDDTYLIVKQITPANFIQRTFIDLFVKKGLLYAFSSEVNVEIENFLTIIPSGKLILSLEKNIADGLSLVAKKTPHHLKKKARFSHQIYTIELNSENFNPGKKLYESTSFELNKLKNVQFDLLVRWKPEGNVCPQSIRSYFESQGYECISCEPKYTHHSNFTVQVPKLDASSFDPDIAEDILEWIGTQICGIEYSNDTDKFVSNFILPEPSETLQKLQIGSFEGFYTGDEVCSLLKEVRKMFEVDKNLPFVAVLISGFQNCYIASKGFEKFSSADKMICLIIFPLLDCWVVTLNT